MVVPLGRDDGTSNAIPRNGGTRKNQRSGREVKEEEEDDGVAGDQIVCTGKACKSCTAELIADCVAVCCCPCAVVDILVLALFKVPWTLGRKCLGLHRKKRNGGGSRICNDRCCSSHRSDGIPRLGSVEDETLEIGSAVFGIREQVVKDNFSTWFDSEEVWLDLYRVGHLGFGRVSFTEIPSQCKGN